jgi:hypothetical protein
VECLGLFNWKNSGLRFRPVINDTTPDFAPIAATHTAPMRDSIEPRGGEVKKEAFMEAIKAIVVNDLQSIFVAKRGGSGRWGCRPLMGIGVMEVQTFEALWRAPNTT